MVAASEPAAVITTAVRQVHRRLRIQASLNAVSRSVPPLAALFGLVLGLRWLLPGPGNTPILLGLGLGLTFTWLSGRMRSPSELAAALRIDALLDRQGQLAAAFDYLSSGAGPDPYTRLLAEREAASLRRRDLSRLLALKPPPGWPVALVTLAALGACLNIAPRVHRSLASAPAAPTAAQPGLLLTPPLSPADVAYLREQAEAAVAKAETREGKQAAEHLRDLVGELEHGSLSKEEGQRRVAALLAELEQAEQIRKAFDQRLSEQGAALGQSQVGKALGKALEDRRLKDAAEALRALAERLADKKKPLSPRELSELREAVAEAQKKKAQAEQAEHQEGGDQAQERLADKRRRLLDKKQSGKASASELNELERTERQLEQLDRRKKQQQQALSDLDRALAEAAREIEELQKKARGQTEAKTPGQKPEDDARGGKDSFERAAESLSHQGAEEMTDAEKEELLTQLQRLKERLRQAEKDGTLQQQLEEFERRAQGQRPGGSSRAGQPVPGGVPDPAAQGRAGESPGDGPTEARAGTGKEPGASHDPKLTGAPSERLEAEAKSIQAAAQDTGQGESESETIRTAAERGFTQGGYERLYQEYKTVLEETMAEESIPAGHRQSVQRYFELIRPREKDSR